MRVVISQSNYIPWKGYMDNIQLADVFVLYDVVQYTRRDWRNRNKIKTPRGLEWLTIPVDVKGKYYQPINETQVKHYEWAASHFEKLRQNYKEAPFWSDYETPLQQLYEQAAGLTYLSDINRLFLEQLNRWLGITTPLRWAREFELAADRTERLAHICTQLGATEYWSGRAAQAYMDEDVFTRRGISVHYFDYEGYPEYPQLHGAFAHGVTVLDLILMKGPDAPRYLLNSYAIKR
jgi:hypothetical protein